MAARSLWWLLHYRSVLIQRDSLQWKGRSLVCTFPHLTGLIFRGSPGHRTQCTWPCVPPDAEHEGATEQVAGEAHTVGPESTDGPSSGLLPRVAFPMADETGAVCKGFPTVRAFVGLLPGVRLLMFQEIGAAVKGFPALPAFEGLLSRVSPLVFSDVGAVPEGFPALHTLEGLLSRVDPLMANVVCLVLKHPPTLTALIGFLPLKRNEHGNPLKVIFK